MTQPVTLTRDGDIGVVIITNPPVNALSQPVRAGIKSAIAEANADPSVAALVIWCEGRTFIAGADIREFGKPLQPPGLDEIINQIENSPKPVIAAIHGTALGGGFELTLGCHYRVAVASAKVGLPEVKLGLLPGAGGTQRLPRLIGPEAALPFIVDGNPVPAPKAKALAIIDEIIEGDLRSGAVAFARKVVSEKRPLRKVSALQVQLKNPDLFAEFEKSIAKKQRGFLAPFHCIKAVKAACELPFVEGCKRERELFMELMESPQSKAQRHVFFAEREVAKIPGLPEDQPTRDIKSVAVVGAGTMGGGITMCFANVGITVTLLEMNQENLERGLNTIRKNYANSVAKGSLKQPDMDKRMALIKATLSYEELRGADLIIEAVFEEMLIKKEVFAKLDTVCKSGAILASNTSYLSIDELAQSTKRPQDVLGMHFFSPANVMKLLENVRGEKTAPDVYSTAMKLGKQIGKVPVLVRVCDGFVGNRMLTPRSREHFFMLEEGALPQQIDKMLYDFGFPMGPFAMGDLAGLDVGWRNRKSRLADLTPREKANTILDKICELGRFGQKTGAGFYKYDDKRNAAPDPLIEELIINQSKERGFTRRAISDQEILERSLYSMINEGAKILEEGIVARPHDIDIVWIYGYGFPVYRGGPMYYADQIGLKVIYDAVLKYQQQLGEEYWKPAPLLERLAREGKGFYNK
jgi:3-hydroxyacyl-CoA dehydrogenase